VPRERAVQAAAAVLAELRRAIDALAPAGAA
jgi:hypothetical protein